MKRSFIGMIALFFLLVSCKAISLGPATPEMDTQDPMVLSTATPSPIPTIPTKTPTASPTTAISPTATRTPIPITAINSPTATKTEHAFKVRTHPDGGLFVGDQISFEVLVPPGSDFSDEVLSISDVIGEQMSLESHFAPFGIAGRNQATIYWGWDTAGLEAGEHPLTFSIQPLGYTWTHTVTLGSAAEIPSPEPLARWASDESDCCIFYYMTETAAAREITNTLMIAEQLADQAVSILETEFTEPLVVTLMPRVLGQGGFASSEIYISFLDRNYAGNSLEMVLNHEMVHILDYRLSGKLRPTILIEGLAVYLSGGHYKPEALIPRAAALLPASDREDGLGLGWYLPLQPLSDDFYNSQHEIGYIQAGALVEYMINTWGWEAYSAFYRDISPIQNGTQSDALDAALQTHFGVTLAELEANFLVMLQAQEITPEIVADVRLTVEFFETMRRYQQILDPSAYFLTAWLPKGPIMRENGIVADLVRRPSELTNVALETLLVTANDSLKAGNILSAVSAQEAVNAVLDAIEAQEPNPFDAHPLAKAHFEIAAQLQKSGYQAEQIDIVDGRAWVVASQGWPDLTPFEFAASNNYWVMVSSQ
jgi:hypothetical protein